ncbi:hypothetical protein VSDG_08066 [Cytospora chrysosperma]|uniref:CFEM domain-containing protein n=1 Tax=Cytospora chrysosperma TaxID=252740 RepID=A0A423VF62_CYTCH|nr:hypothetical protein VSDG_08066 [Valsa sordida]
MQFKTIAISTFIGLAAAASSTDVSALTNELPSCSLLCLMSGASTAGCEATDYACQCENQAAITTASTSCLKSACSAADIGTTKSVTTKICNALTGSSDSTQTASNATMTSSTSSATSSPATSSSATSSSTDSSAGSRPELYGLGLAAIAGLAGLMLV